LRDDAAELFVIDKFFNGRVFTANRALRIAAQLEFAELHVERVEKEQTANE
jgi:hypothetical protein